MRRNSLVTMVLSVAAALASGWTILSSVQPYCDERPRLTVLATLAAFLIALGFRQLGTAPGRRWLLWLSMTLAGATLFTDARVVVRNRGACSPAEKTQPQFQTPGTRPDRQ